MPQPTPEREAARYQGIRGWLLFFCIAMSAGPVLSLVLLGHRLTVWLPKAGTYGKHVFLLSVDTALALGLIAFGIYAAVSLWRLNPAAVLRAKMFLIAYPLYALLSASVPFVVSGMFSDRNLVYLQLAWSIVAPVITAVVWYAYLSRSKRVAATYGAARIENETWRRLASTKDLGEVLPLRRDGFSMQTALGYFVAALLSLQIHPTLMFFSDPAFARVRSGGAFATDLIGISIGTAGLLVAMPGALLFAGVLGVTMKAWQRIVAWALAFALLSAIRSWLMFAFQPLFVNLFHAQGQLLIPPSGSAVAMTFLFGALWGGLFMAGLLLAVRFWGLRLWSVAVGALAPDIADVVVGAILSGPGSLLHPASFAPVVSGLLYGTLIYAGIYVHSLNRQVAGVSAEKEVPMEALPQTESPKQRRVSIVGIVISLLSFAAAVKMVVAPGPFPIFWSSALSQFAAGICLFAWSVMRTRRIGWGFASWFGGAVAGAVVGALTLLI